MSGKRASQDFPHVDYEHFESYSERFKDFFQMRREDGIIEVKWHDGNGGVAPWSYGLHNAIGRVMSAIAQDPENEILIFGNAGDEWIGSVSMDYAMYMVTNMMEDRQEFARSTYDHQFRDGGDIIWPFVFQLHIPTIGVVNGTMYGHAELPLLCDVTLCTEETTFGEPHYAAGGIPAGDGGYLVFQECFGTKRANNMVILNQTVSAQQALECGAVAEIHKKGEVYDRAWDIARKLNKHDRYCNRLQHEIAMQKWRRIINADYNFNFAAEEWGELLNDPDILKEATSKISDVDAFLAETEV